MNKDCKKSGPFRVRLSTEKENKPGTAQVGAISKGQKQQKDFKVSKYLFYGTGKTQKLNRIGAPEGTL